MLALQRTAGNRVVGRLLRSGTGVDPAADILAFRRSSFPTRKDYEPSPGKGRFDVDLVLTSSGQTRRRRSTGPAT